MSSSRTPARRPSPAVYRRRRIVLGAALLVVIIVVVLLILHPWTSKGSPVAVPSETPVATSAATSAPTSTSIPTTSTAKSGAPCKPADLTVGAITDATSYAAGQLPKLSLSLTNNGPSACKINAGTSQQVFTITSGSQVYWKSTDCQTGATNAEVLLQPGKTITSQTPITWDRTKSDPATCSATRPPVPAGGASYHLQTSVGGELSATDPQFILN